MVRVCKFNFIIFFMSYHPLIINPLWWGPYCVSQSLLCLGLFTQSSLLLRCRLSLVADIVYIGCSVGYVVLVVELHSRVIWAHASICLITRVIRQICSGYVSFFAQREINCDSFFWPRLGSCESLQTYIKNSCIMRINRAWKHLFWSSSVRFKWRGSVYDGSVPWALWLWSLCKLIQIWFSSWRRFKFLHPKLKKFMSIFSQ